MLERFSIRLGESQWGYSVAENERGYAFGVTLESAPEATPQVLNKNAGCLQWLQKNGS